MIYFIIAVFVCAFFIFCYYQNNKIDLTYYTIESEKCKKNFKIVHLSDFHSKPFKAVLKKTADEKPDMICVTGDFINDHRKTKAKIME